MKHRGQSSTTDPIRREPSTPLSSVRFVDGLTDTLRSEGQAIARSSRLHLAHWVALGLSLAVTLVAWQISERSVQAKADELFDRQADVAMGMIEERMERYEDALRSGVAAIHANGGEMDLEEWATFASSLHLESKYPGVNGIGVIYHVPLEERDSFLADQQLSRPDFTIHPEHDEDEYLPITYIEPVGANLAAVGLDVAHETNRYNGIKAARDLAEPQITGPIILVQDEKHTPGFLFYSPYYRTIDPPATATERREGFIGAVYAPFIVSNLMEGTLSHANRLVGVTIRDTDVTLYDENTPDSPHYAEDPMYERVVGSYVYGRIWTFTIRSDDEFGGQVNSSQPVLVLAGGLVLDSSLFLLFILLVRANGRALQFGEKVTGELMASNRRLSESNTELERFAYVAAHDLQTPLRGIGDLSEYLEEDLEAVIPDGVDRSEVDRNLVRIRRQTERMTSMVRGVLAYSRVGSEQVHYDPSEVDIAAFIQDMQHDLGLAPGQLEARGATRLMVADRVSLLQVLQNLVGNAVEHHPNRDDAHVVVDVDESKSRCFLEIRVVDNGGGIDPRFHDRVFELFQSLKVDNNGTGLGLAIVKKIVERHQGKVSIDSALGKGTTFVVSWPVPVDKENDPCSKNKELALSALSAAKRGA